MNRRLKTNQFVLCLLLVAVGCWGMMDGLTRVLSP